MEDKAYLCPKCLGQGVTCRPPNTPADTDHYLSDSSVHECDVCNGAKVLYKKLLTSESDLIEFVMYLTGYKEEQVIRIYKNWINNIKNN